MMEQCIWVEKWLVELLNRLESGPRCSNPTVLTRMVVNSLLNDLLKLCERGEAFP
jgi:hypothetical protein